MWILHLLTFDKSSSNDFKGNLLPKSISIHIVIQDIFIWLRNFLSFNNKKIFILKLTCSKTLFQCMFSLVSLISYLKFIFCLERDIGFLLKKKCTLFSGNKIYKLFHFWDIKITCLKILQKQLGFFNQFFIWKTWSYKNWFTGACNTSVEVDCCLPYIYSLFSPN